MKRAFCRTAALLLCIILVLPSALPVRAESGNAEYFANLVVFVHFQGDGGENYMNEPKQGSGYRTPAQDSFEYWSNASKSIKSLPNYLKAVSYDQFRVQDYLPQREESTGSVSVYELSAQARSNEVLLVKETVAAINRQNPQISEQILDYNQDGMVDNLTIVAYSDSSVDGDQDILHPHKTNYYGDDKIAGKRVYSYNVLNSYSVFRDTLSAQGVICHEFLHTIGFPDLYHKGGNTSPVGSWDIMASNSSFLQFPLAYLRMHFKNWLKIDTITGSRKNLTLKPADQAEGDRAFIFKTPLSDTEFFVAEYRKKGTDINGLEYKHPSSGLILYRVNTKYNDELSNITGDDSVSVFSAGYEMPMPKKNTDALRASCFSGAAGQNYFGSSDLNETNSGKALAYSDGTNSGICIKNISAPGDTISFDVEFTDLSQVRPWTSYTPDLFRNQAWVGMEMLPDKEGNIYAVGSKVWGGIAVYFRDARTGSWTERNTAKLPANISNVRAAVYQNKLYLIYNSGSDFSLYLAEDTGSGFEVLGKASAGMTQYSDMAVGEDGIYIACTSGSGDQSWLNIKRWNKISGFTNAAERTAAGYITYPSLAVDGKKIYCSAGDFAKDKIIVRKLEGKKVTEMAVPANIPYGITDLTVDASGRLYLGNSVSADGLTVYRMEGNVWKTLGNKTGSVSEYRLISEGDKVYRLVSDQSLNKTYVQYFNGSGWVKLGSALESDVTSQISGFYSEGRLYSGYLLKKGDSNYPVLKYLKLDTEEKPAEEPVKKPVIQVSSIKMASAVTLLPGSRYTLKPTVLPTNAADKKLAYYTSNSKTAAVDSSGRITAVNNGTAKITARSANGKKAVCTVTVRMNPLKSLKAYGQTRSSVNLSWGKVSGAAGYTVYRQSGSKWVTVKSTTALKYKVSRLSAAKSYTFRVSPYRYSGKTKVYGSGKAIKTATATAAPKMRSISRKNGRRAYLRWYRTSGASGYEIYQSAKKKSGYSRVKTITKGSTTSYTRQGLKRKKTYYYKIRTYRIIGGKKIYSTFSAPKSIRIK